MFGIAPDVLSFAPGRTNLIGEHIDYNDGVVLPFAISQGVYCGISRNGTGSDTIASQNRFGEVVDIPIGKHQESLYPQWASYIVGSLVEVRALMSIHEGLSVSIFSNLPEGAGLSSSAALESAVLLALKQLYSLAMTEMEMAKLAQQIEHEFAGTPCGLMDQVASIFGSAGCAIAFDVLEEEISYVACDPAKDGFAFIICDTNIPHELASSEYVLRRNQCESAARKLGIQSLRNFSGELPLAFLTKVENIRLRHVMTEIQRVKRAQEILMQSRWDEFGALMYQSHLSLRDNFEVSIPAIDSAVEAAMTAGASGARIVGGGFGGSILVLVRQESIESVTVAMVSALSLFGSVPRFISVEPSQGAHILYPGSLK